MTESKRKNVKKEPEKYKEGIIVNHLEIRSADHSKKDIGDYREAKEIAAQIFSPNRTKLYDLYDDIMLDGHLTGIIGKLVDSVLNKDIVFKVNRKKVDEMDNTIESDAFRSVVTMIIEKKLWGLSGMEFIPGSTLAFSPIPRKHIKPHLRLITTEQYGQDGYPYDGVSNLWVLADKYDLGLLLKCAPYAIYKRGNMADWAQYIEIFGQPIRIVKYDAYDAKTKMELKQVMDESGSSLVLMIPKQADFDIKDGKQSNGDGKLQESFKRACDDEMSVIVLGNTETTTSSASSGYAQSKEHGKQQIQVTKSLLKYVQNQLNCIQFLNILASYNLPVVGGRFEFEKEFDVLALAAKAEVDTVVAEQVPIEDDYWYETYNIPKPVNYAELKKKFDERKNAVPATDPGISTNQKEDKKKKKTNLAGHVTGYERFKLWAAGFFLPAPKDL